MPQKSHKSLTNSPLCHALSPTVTVLEAFKSASRWRAVRNAWKGAALWRRGVALMLVILLLVAGAFCIVLQSNILLAVCAALTIVAALFIRYGIIDRYAPLLPWRRFDKAFELNYRFRRYLWFRDELATAGIGVPQIRGIRVVLAQEKKFLEGKAIPIGPGITTLLAVVASILTTLSTRESVVQSGLSFIILALALVAIFAAWLSRQSVPTAREENLEIETFLTWYELELGGHAETQVAESTAA
jgi:hypothetical protein